MGIDIRYYPTIENIKKLWGSLGGLQKQFKSGVGDGILLTDPYTATAGTNTYTDTDLIGKKLLYVVVNGNKIYREGNTATAGTVTFDEDTGTITFLDNFSSGDSIWVAYANDPNYTGPTPPAPTNDYVVSDYVVDDYVA